MTWIFNSSLHLTCFLIFWGLIIISDSFASILVAYPIKVTPIHSSNSLSFWQALMEEIIICQTQRRTAVPYKMSLHPHKTLYLHRLHVVFMPQSEDADCKIICTFLVKIHVYFMNLLMCEIRYEKTIVDQDKFNIVLKDTLALRFLSFTLGVWKSHRLFVSMYVYSNMTVLILKIQQIFNQKTFSLKVSMKTSVSICFRVCSYLAGLI